MLNVSRELAELVQIIDRLRLEELGSGFYLVLHLDNLRLYRIGPRAHYSPDTEVRFPQQLLS